MWNTGMLSLNRKWPFIRSHVFFCFFFVALSGWYTDMCLNSTHMESRQSLFHISWDQHVPLWPPSVTVARHLVVCTTWVMASGWNVSLFFENSSGMVTAVWSWQDTVSLSGSDHLHYKIFQPPPSSSSTILITPRTATCRSFLRGPAPSGASASAPTPRAWSVFPPDAASALQAADRHSTCSQRTLTMHARGQVTGSWRPNHTGSQSQVGHEAFRMNTIHSTLTETFPS